MSETTKKEQEFVLKVFEVVQEYENSDFNIIESLGAIFKVVFFVKVNKTSMDEIIKDNKKKWGID